MQTTKPRNRREFLKLTAGAGAAAIGGSAFAQVFEFTPNQRYPDPAIKILDPSFTKYRIFSSTVEQLASGMRWAEGPVYFPEDGGYVLVSDIPNNRIMKYSEKDGSFEVFKEPSNWANGNTRDRQGRLITCEHSETRRVVRTEKDGSQTVLADAFEEKLNAPNDVVVKSDDTIWFTDPLFGINGEWEGYRAKPEQETTNVYRIDAEGKLTAVITDIVNPNGLAFSPDEAKLYVVEWKGTPNRSIWSFDVNDDGTVSNKTKLIDASDYGALDGFKVDRDGNLWCGWGSNGALKEEPTEQGGRKVYELKGKPEELDGVMVFNAQGKPLAHISLPERCANLCFGGPKNNRLYMASSHSLYALYVEAHGAV